MVLLLTVTILAVISYQGRVAGSPVQIIDTMRSDVDNDLNPKGSESFQPTYPNWLKFVNVPQNVVRRNIDETTELECIVQGAPPPSIRWLRDNVPITQTESYEDNILPESSIMLMAKVTSRLVINNIFPNHKNTYTCVAQAGFKTIFHSTTVYTTGKPLKLNNLTEYLMLNKDTLSAPTKPRILTFYEIVLEVTGSTLTLPCRNMGNPRPEINWLDNNEELITESDSRRKIMPSGDLVIEGLNWGDMGGYTCIAKNPVARDSISTFVYPLHPN